MNESTRDWFPNKDRGRRRGGSEDDEDEDFMHALTHSPSQQEHAHTQHTPQANPKKRSTQSIQPIGKRKRGKPSDAEKVCAARAAAPAPAPAVTAAAPAEAPLP